MPRFKVEAEFSLYTSIEYDGYGDIGDSSADDYADDSYFDGAEVNVSGGRITFTVEAEDEDDAERKAEEVISDGVEVEDRNGLTWGVNDVNFTIERDEMSRDEALVVIRRFLDRLVTEGSLPSDVREAFDVVLQDS